MRLYEYELVFGSKEAFAAMTVARLKMYCSHYSTAYPISGDWLTVRGLK